MYNPLSYFVFQANKNISGQEGIVLAAFLCNNKKNYRIVDCFLFLILKGEGNA